MFLKPCMRSGALFLKTYKVFENIMSSFNGSTKNLWGLGSKMIIVKLGFPPTSWWMTRWNWI